MTDAALPNPDDTNKGSESFGPGFIPPGTPVTPKKTPSYHGGPGLLFWILLLLGLLVVLAILRGI